MRLSPRVCLTNGLRLGRVELVLLGTLLSFFMTSGSVFAQVNESHWAVHFSVTPAWELAGFFEDLVEEGDEVNIKGTEFTIGFGRGRPLGGDWGVSFVRKPFKSGQVVTDRSSDCFQLLNESVCSNTLETTFFNDVVLTGVEVHRFFSFVRIKDRVQIGLNIAGGIASFDGEVTTVTDNQFPTLAPPNRIVFVSERNEETNPASEELFEIFPLVKVEAAGAVIFHPSFKVKVAGGLNFPGTGFRVLATYLIGAR